MGPQPWELRKLGRDVDERTISLTSMGPQPWELRKLVGTQAYEQRRQDFNGAAALGAAETRNLLLAIVE